jgi:hypothetical protein
MASLAVALIAPAVALTVSAAALPALARTAHAQQGGAAGREQSALAEDQALLMRQLQRLRQTMEVLAQRFEAEGRTHAAKLLRDGIAHLAARAEESGAKTLEELLSSAHQNLEAGQANQAIETQRQAIESLERLYAILTDRQGLENLEKGLQDLKRIQADLKALADRESKLRTDTQALDQTATNDKQRELASGIQKALAEQRRILQRTESESRASGNLDIEALERDLDELIRRQSTDREVLQSWKPSEVAGLESASPALDRAGEHAARAHRLAEAASQLRAAARSTRSDKPDMQAVARDLEHAAELEERHERASNDPAAAKAAAALNAGADDVKKSDVAPEARAKTAESLDARAAELAREAQSESDASDEAARAAGAALDKLKDEKSAAGRAAQDVRQALAGDAASKEGAAGDKNDARAGEKGAGDQRAGDAEKRSGDGDKRAGDSDKRAAESEPRSADPERRAIEAERRAGEARRALSAGLDDLHMLKRALSVSQSAAAEESQRLARALESLPQGATPDGKSASEKLASASTEQKNAADSAGREQPEEAAQAAQRAESALRAARESLERTRAQSAAAASKSAQTDALQREEQELAAKMNELKESAAQSSLSHAGKDAARGALEKAQGAMQKAAQSLSQGKSSESSKSQGEALENLQAAARAAEGGSELEKPEDKAKAKELAEEQEKIRRELMDLARRNQKRETAQPSPNLDKAAESAESAQQSLQEGDLGEAQSGEEETEKRMRQALSDLGHEEEQYQKLRQEELLFKIAEQVKSLIDEHQQQMKATLEVDAGRKPGEPANHTQRLRLRKIAKAEEALGGRAAEISKAIRAEQSVVFAEVLDQAEHDLKRLGQDMSEPGDYQSGERVQALQQDIDQSLGWLAEALQQEKERRKKEQQSGQQQNQRPSENRLVPDVAELKLLRRLELETIDGLERLQTVHPELKGNGEVDPLVLEDVRRLAYRHQRMSDLFQKFRKRLGLPDPGDE